MNGSSGKNDTNSNGGERPKPDPNVKPPAFELLTEGYDPQYGKEIDFQDKMTVVEVVWQLRREHRRLKDTKTRDVLCLRETLRNLISVLWRLQGLAQRRYSLTGRVARKVLESLLSISESKGHPSRLPGGTADKVRYDLTSGTESPAREARRLGCS